MTYTQLVKKKEEEAFIKKEENLAVMQYVFEKEYRVKERRRKVSEGSFRECGSILFAAGGGSFRPCHGHKQHSPSSGSNSLLPSFLPDSFPDKLDDIKHFHALG